MKPASAYAFTAIEKDIERPRRVDAYWEDESLFTLKVHGREDGESVVVSLDAELAAALARALVGDNAAALDIKEEPEE